MKDKVFFNQHTAQFNYDKRNSDDIEYLRKDALLEWLNDQIEVYDAHLKGQNDAAWWHERYAFKQVIDKLNSL